TTGPISSPTPAVLGTNGTTVLAGGTPLDYHGFSGVRVEVGTWFDLHESLGCSVRGFVLEQKSASAAVGADITGARAVGGPFIDANTGEENVDFVTVPGRLAGGVVVESASRLWGIEADLLSNVLTTTVHGPRTGRPIADLRLDLLGGFRFLDLVEDLNIHENS